MHVFISRSYKSQQTRHCGQLPGRGGKYIGGPPPGASDFTGIAAHNTNMKTRAIIDTFFPILSPIPFLVCEDSIFRRQKSTWGIRSQTRYQTLNGLARCSIHPPVVASPSISLGSISSLTSLPPCNSFLFIPLVLRALAVYLLSFSLKKHPRGRVLARKPPGA